MAITILRMPDVKRRRGKSRSATYNEIAQGLFPPPVALGPRCVGWPEHEVDAMNAATIAGKSQAELRALVRKLVIERKAAA